MPPIGLILKAGPYVIIVALLGWIGWLKYEASQRDLAEAKAVIEFKTKAEKLANELVIEQAIAMSKTIVVAADAKERIRNVSVPPNEAACEPICAASQRQRLGTLGVRDTLHGGPAARP